MPTYDGQKDGHDGLKWDLMGTTGDNMPFTMPEVVRTSGDMTAQDQVIEIDTCQYALETYPKGYTRASQMGEMPEGGQYRADWHPQGANFRGNTRDDTNPAEADKPAETL